MTNRRISLLAATALGSICAMGACDNTDGVAKDYAPLLQSLTDTAILPALDAAATRADALSAATHALMTNATADSLTAAQAAWRDARAKWRLLDAYYFGPVADDGIADRIDLAPAKANDIDAVIAGTPPIDVAYVGTLGGKSKGFLGLEYLLFAKGGNAAVLAMLQGDGAAARRRAFAAAISDEIASSAHQLKDAWDPAKGGFATTVKTAGSGSARYPTQIAALADIANAASAAIEIVVGSRLAVPLGHKSTGSPDPTLDPTSLSDSAVADMTSTLDSVKSIYANPQLSTAIKSFSVSLAATSQAQMSACATSVTAMPTPFDTTLVKNTAAVQAAYDSCKAWKTTWNADIVSALGVALYSTDKDGD